MSHTAVELVPSFPAPSWSALEAALETLQGETTQFQVDIVDGQFVSATSWPFTEGAESVADSLQRLRDWSSHYELEVDCMVNAPEQYLDRLVAVGAMRVIVHYGSTEHFADIIVHAKAHAYQLGLAFTNDVFESERTSLDELIAQVDYVQVMGIKAVGAQGQPFDERTLTTVHTLREVFPTLTIAVDGSVNADTIPDLVTAGATRLAPGSAVITSPDPVAAYQSLRALVHS